MALILQSLKEKFPSIYNLLLNNQKEKDLIFFAPDKLLYAKSSLNDKSFYYNHIFQKSKFDSSLYTNFFGKVLKLVKEKTYQTYLGWSLDMTINVVEESYNEDNLFFFQTDGTCIEKDAKVEKISERQSIPLKKFKTSEEYIKYYSEYNNPEYKNFQRGINSMKSFLFTVLNNYLLLKGNEEDFSNLLKEKINNFVSAFEIIFRDKSSIAREYVDSFIFPFIYDKIMEKMDSFYSEEQAQLKQKIDENIDRYSLTELNLDSSLVNCKFEKTFEKIEKLKNYKTNFEKINCLFDINNSIVEEIKTEYEKNNDKQLEIQGDILTACWTYVLANYIQKNNAKNIYHEYLFFKYFQMNKGYEKDDYISISFISSIELMQNELLNKNKIPKVEIIKVSSLD